MAIPRFLVVFAGDLATPGYGRKRTWCRRPADPPAPPASGRPYRQPPPGCQGTGVLAPFRKSSRILGLERSRGRAGRAWVCWRWPREGYDAPLSRRIPTHRADPPAPEPRRTCGAGSSAPGRAARTPPPRCASWSSRRRPPPDVFGLLCATPASVDVGENRVQAAAERRPGAPAGLDLARHRAPPAQQGRSGRGPVRRLPRARLRASRRAAGGRSWLTPSRRWPVYIAGQCRRRPGQGGAVRPRRPSPS